MILADTWMDSSKPTVVHEGGSEVTFGFAPGKIFHALLGIDLSGLLPVPIVSAALSYSLFPDAIFTDPATMYLVSDVSPDIIVVGEVTWNNYSTLNAWSNPGGDIEDPPVGVPFNKPALGRADVDIASLLEPARVAGFPIAWILVVGNSDPVVSFNMTSIESGTGPTIVIIQNTTLLNPTRGVVSQGSTRGDGAAPVTDASVSTPIIDANISAPVTDASVSINDTVGKV